MPPRWSAVGPSSRTLLTFAERLGCTGLTTHYVWQGFSDRELEPLLAHTRHFHARGSAPGRMQARLSESTIDWERAIDAMHEYGYDGDLAVEYVWSESEPGLNEVDVLSESILLLDRLQAKLDEARLPS